MTDSPKLTADHPAVLAMMVTPDVDPIAAPEFECPKCGQHTIVARGEPSLDQRDAGADALTYRIVWACTDPECNFKVDPGAPPTELGHPTPHRPLNSISGLGNDSPIWTMLALQTKREDGIELEIPCPECGTRKLHIRGHAPKRVETDQKGRTVTMTVSLSCSGCGSLDTEDRAIRLPPA